MKFESGVITVILLAGLSIIPAYGLYGGNITPSIPVQQQMAASVGKSFSGSAAGGMQTERPAPDCRSCAKTTPSTKILTSKLKS